MNILIERIKETDSQTEALNRILRNKDFRSGLKICLTVGQDGEQVEMSFGTVSNAEEDILESLLIGLHNTNLYYREKLTEEAREVNEFLKKING